MRNSQTQKSDNSQQKKRPEVNLLQIEALTFKNNSLQTQIQSLKDQITRLNKSNHQLQYKYNSDRCEKQAKTIDSSTKSPSTQNRTKEFQQTVRKIQESFTQQLQQQKKKQQQRIKQNQAQILKFKDQNFKLSKQLAASKTQKYNLQQVISSYQKPQPYTQKLSQIVEEISARKEKLQTEHSQSNLNQILIIKEQLQTVRKLKENTEEKERKKQEESKKYNKIIKTLQAENNSKQTQITQLQKEATQYNSSLTSLNNSVINFLTQFGSFDNIVTLYEPEKTQFPKIVNQLNAYKKQKKISSDWEKIAKKLLEIQGTSIKKQKEAFKKQIENLKRTLNDTSKLLEKTEKDKKQNALTIQQITDQYTIDRNQLQTARNDLATKLQTKQIELQAKKKQITNLQSQKTNLQSSLKSSQKQAADWQTKYQTTSKEYQKYKDTKDSQLANNRQTIQTLTRKIEQQTTVITTSKKQIQDKSLEINSLKDRISKLQKDSTSRTTQLQTQKTNLLNDRTKLQSEKSTLQQKADSLQKQLSKYKNDNSTLSKKIAQVTRDLQKSISQLRDLQKKYELLAKQCKQNKQAYDSLQRAYRTKERNTSEFLSILDMHILHQNSRINIKQAQLPEVAKEVINIYNQARFFNDSHIIPPERVSFLIKAIQDLNNQHCKATKLLYRLDPLNTTNFHQYIDRKENLFVVVKLTNGSIVGGFTNYTLETGVPSTPGKGFCFNLNFQRVFRAREIPATNVTTYDNFYFILGNAEIRLRAGEKKIFSNFAIAKSYFDNQQFTRTQFLGVNRPENNEQDVDCYEFYTIEFQTQ